MYLSRILLYSVIMSALGAIVGVVLTFLLSEAGVLQSIDLSIQIGGSVGAFIASNELLIQGILLVIISMVFLGLPTFLIMYYYPSFLAGERKRKINRTLPHAVTFMYALSRGGMNIIEVMDSLADADDAYGEISKEFDMIIRDMEYFGNDLRLALRNASEITPSDNLSNFLDDLLSVIDSGGELTPFLLNKSEQYLETARREQENFIDTLVTAFVAGTLFIIIMTSIMAMLGGANMMQLYAIVYGVIPIGTAGFAVVIDILSTGSDEANKELERNTELFDLEQMEAIAEANGGQLKQDR
ncbi:MAG: type II secretion system F family protein, partial [Halobacteria archaeon]|nr:type II secretion system F family protein [Halobacteria archaeon]